MTSKANICDMYRYTYTPKLARIAQREKNINEFWLQNLLWGCLCDSKLQKTKKLTEPFWRAGGTQAETSAKFGQNRLCVSAAISKMAQWIFLFFAILNHINISITNFEVRICWSFFPSEQPLPTWVTYYLYFYTKLENTKFQNTCIISKCTVNMLVPKAAI